MKFIFTLSFTLFSLFAFSQTAIIKGQLQSAEGEAIAFANVALYNAVDSSLTKVETTSESGIFKMQGIAAGSYKLTATFVGVADLSKNGIKLTDGQELDLGVLSFSAAAVDLAQATVKAQRAIVEIKPDRTVFNVQGTINSTGEDALSLMRKAPGVLLDNNDNITVLGRSGVLVYVDGKRLPLSGADLAGYLQNLQADQIDRVDIITNPGAKYEAEGNAGIIDILLKKDKNIGTNGAVNLAASQGELGRVNGGFSGNYRNKQMNVFGNVGAADGKRFNEMEFRNFQNNFLMDESERSVSESPSLNFRIGTDFFISKKQTIGFLVSGLENKTNSNSLNRILISGASPERIAAPIDSILVANNESENSSSNYTANVNYRYDDRKKGQSLNIDLDYGNYKNTSLRYQPNLYFDPTESDILTEVINTFDTPTDINIYTAKLDYDQDFLGGKVGLGAKYSSVISDNTFLFNDEIGGQVIQNNLFSNIFDYDENVLAGYLSFNRSLDKQWKISLGLRAEQTNALGELTPFIDSLNAPRLDTSYLQFFPSAGLTYALNRTNTLSLNYGRRINRPDYNVLNPFNNRLSELSYQKGNPFLRPEIVNNIELGWTYQYRYNFKLAYSNTADQITRIIAPDVRLDDNGMPIGKDNGGDVRAGFITWDNIATQKIYAASASLPFQFSKIWSAFINLSGNYQDNQADYGDGLVIDVQNFSYNIYQQHTIGLGKGWKGEISGYFAGPGIWGGVFQYRETWSLNLGVQRKFLNDQLNVRLAANDIFYQSGWRGFSEYGGLYSEGNGNWDSRRASLSFNYNFGNQNVKSRKRKTGIEDEAGRVN